MKPLLVTCVFWCSSCQSVSIYIATEGFLFLLKMTSAFVCETQIPHDCARHCTSTSSHRDTLEQNEEGEDSICMLRGADKQMQTIQQHQYDQYGRGNLFIHLFMYRIISGTNGDGRPGQSQKSSSRFLVELHEAHSTHELGRHFSNVYNSIFSTFAMDADHEDHGDGHLQISVGALLSWTTDEFYGRSFLQEINRGRKDSLA